MSLNSHISIILVEPQQAGNVGSVARAMGNMGISLLKIVAPSCDLADNDAIKMAMDGKSILKSAQIFTTLEDAIAESHVVIGTSRRKRRRLYPVLTSHEVAQKIVSLDSKTNIALIFGREDKGLSNHDLSLCQIYSTIPTSLEIPSLNLAQAVLIYVHEIYLVLGGISDQLQKRPAKALEVKAMYDQLKDVLLQINFINRGDPENMMQSIRSMFNRSHLTSREVRIIRGISATMKYVADQKNLPNPKKPAF